MRKSRLYAGFFVGGRHADEKTFGRMVASHTLFFTVEVAVEFRVKMPQALFLFAPDGAVKTFRA
jgi:hypothetical protein